MAIARDTTAANIKPLEGAIIRRYTAGATISAGQPVALLSTGLVSPTVGTSVAAAMAVGIAIEAAISGGRLDVVTFGPVLCLTGATVAAIVYVGDSAGTPVETAGTKTVILGYNESATILFVRIQIVSLS